MLGIFLVLSSILTTNLNSVTGFCDKNSEYSDDTNQDKENLKTSKISGPIYIDDTNPSANWSVAKDAGLCTGNGTYSDPYVIKDLEIDGGGSGSCIWIENSNVYFRIENCTLYNSGSYLPYVGIGLLYVNNSIISYLDVYNTTTAISLKYCYNNTISNNNAHNNKFLGFALYYSYYNLISGNNASYNNGGGYLHDSPHNSISKNTLNNNNEDGIYLYRSHYNFISGNIANLNSENGIKLWYSDYNLISGNTANNNIEIGIYLAYYSNYNTISGNDLKGNDKCIEEYNCKGNKFSNNKYCDYGEGDGRIPGYNLFVLLGILSIVAITLSKKLKKS